MNTISFVKIKDVRYDEIVVVNVNCIALIYENSGTIVVNGDHGDGNGLIHTNAEGIRSIELAINELARR